MSDRKYRQRGYQDSDRGDDRGRSRGPRPPREKRQGPRGRGLGAPTETVFRCAVCGRKQDPPTGQAATCVQCGTDLHTCTHCAAFDTSAPKACRKPVEVAVSSKAKRNECELYEPKMAQEFGADSADATDARAAFDALFDF